MHNKVVILHRQTKREAMIQREAKLEQQFIEQLQELNYIYRNEIHNQESLRNNFREKFERLNFVHLSDHEFERLLGEIITPDVFKASQLLREKQRHTV